MLHEETVKPETIDLIKRLSADKTLQDFVLVGGTALALQLGHRKSIDIDLFTPEAFDPKGIAEHLIHSYQTERITAIKNGVFAKVEGVKLDIVGYQADWVYPPLYIEGIRMASLDDIAATKLHAIHQSGARVKDFIDIYFLLEHRSLDEMSAAYEIKYPDSRAVLARLALLHHADIDFKWDMSVLTRPFNWEEIEKRLRLSNITPKHIFASDPLNLNPSNNQKVKKQKGKRL